MNEFIASLKQEFENNENSEIAQQQKAYMRGKFEYYGIKSPLRREIQKPFMIKKFLPKKEEAFEIIDELWKKDQREYQMFAIDFLDKYKKQFDIEDIVFLEKLVVNKSWWDTVDFLAYKQMGEYFKRYPNKIMEYNQKWLNSDNLWLQRSAILFQLKYKEDLNKELLKNTIMSLLGSKEFFINKAIGWILREYSRTDANWVVDFVRSTDLSPLSRKEALRLLEK